MIDIQNISFKYGKKQVLSHISMTLQAGKIYGLLGENGVGKTTLLKIISGLQKPCGGACTVYDENPFHRTPSFLSRVYYLPEELEYIQTDYSARRFAQLNGVFYPRFDFAKFNDILGEFEVDGDKKLSHLSHGQTKKAAIAFAIATNVDLLLMDEPSNGLDIPSKTMFRKIMAQYCLDTTCTVISTHQVRDLENLIDPVIILDNQTTLLNADLETISQKLHFGITSAPPANAFYVEPALGGYFSVSENTDGRESRVNLEALFNAVVQHKGRMQELFSESQDNRLID